MYSYSALPLGKFLNSSTNESTAPVDHPVLLGTPAEAVGDIHPSSSPIFLCQYTRVLLFNLKHGGAPSSLGS